MDAATVFEEATLQLQVKLGVGAVSHASVVAAASSPHAPTTPAEWNRVFAIWHAEMFVSMSAFEFYLAEQAAPMEDYTLSLVELSGPTVEYGVEGRRVVFVKWCYECSGRPNLPCG